MSKRNRAALVPLAALLLALAPALAGRDSGAHARQHKHAARKSQPASPPRKAATRYACPMHPDVVSTKPGSCPECGMFLKAPGEQPAAETKATTPAAPTSPSSTSPSSTNEAPTPTLAAASAAYFPNHALVTQDGRRLRFYEDLVKGKVVLINFMFTTCAGVCPPMTANLAKVQERLGERLGRDVVIISISVDPTTDTPARLRQYAERFKARPGWHFLTGEKRNVDWVLYKLGGYVEDPTRHSGTLIIGNEATGEWLKTAALHDPARIAEAVNALLAKDTRP